MNMYILLGLICMASFAYGNYDYRGNWQNVKKGFLGRGHDYGVKGYNWYGNKGYDLGKRGYNWYGRKDYGLRGRGFGGWLPRSCKGKWCGGYRRGYTGGFLGYNGGFGAYKGGATAYLPRGYNRGYTYYRGFDDDDDDDERNYMIRVRSSSFGRYNYRHFGRPGYDYFPRRAFLPKKIKR